MSVIQDIQAELIAAYEALTLPNGIGSPTGYKHESENGFGASDVPLVIVGRGIKTSDVPLSSDRAIITREYITDLLCYVMTDEGVYATERNNTTDCIQVIEKAFNIYGLSTSGVIAHRITADTNDTEVYTRYGSEFIGVRFRHEITFIQVRE